MTAKDFFLNQVHHFVKSLVIAEKDLLTLAYCLKCLLLAFISVTWLD